MDVACSVLEIYNEVLTDLLADPGADPTDGPTRVRIRSESELAALLAAGSKRRRHEEEEEEEELDGGCISQEPSAQELARARAEAVSARLRGESHPFTKALDDAIKQGGPPRG